MFISQTGLTYFYKWPITCESQILKLIKCGSTLDSRASCDRSEDTTRRLWSHEHPASLWCVQYLNSVCDWSKFIWVFSLVNLWASVNQWKDSHKFRRITNRVQILNSPKWGWMLVWPEPVLVVSSLLSQEALEPRVVWKLVGFATDVTRGFSFSPLVNFAPQRASGTRVYLYIY
jgi:hypothetical protein